MLWASHNRRGSQWAPKSVTLRTLARQRSPSAPPKPAPSPPSPHPRTATKKESSLCHRCSCKEAEQSQRYRYRAAHPPPAHPPSHPTAGIAGCSSAEGRSCGNVWVPGVRRGRRHRPTGRREAATRASSAWSQGAPSSQDGPGSCGHVQHARVAKSSNGTHMRGRAVHQQQLRVTSSHTLAGTACQAGDCGCTSGCKGGHP